jgi:hypothetical protein
MYKILNWNLCPGFELVSGKNEAENCWSTILGMYSMKTWLKGLAKKLAIRLLLFNSSLIS